MKIVDNKLILTEIAKYHLAEMHKRGFPWQLDLKTVYDKQQDWFYIPAVRPVFLFRDAPLKLPGLQFPQYKFPTILSDWYIEKNTIALSDFRQQAKRDDVVLVLIESYNEAVKQFFFKFDIQESYFWQVKLICDLSRVGNKKPQIPDNVKIRNFKVDNDEQRYIEIYNSVLGYLGNIVNHGFIENVKSRKSFNLGGYFFAEADGQTVGFISIEIDPWGTAGRQFAYIYQIGVIDSWKGSGLAGALLYYAIDFAKKNNCSRVGVGVRQSNLAALHFFQNHGFKKSYDICGYLVQTSELDI